MIITAFIISSSLGILIELSKNVDWVLEEITDVELVPQLTGKDYLFCYVKVGPI